jgi:hypothetical protein
MTDNKSEDLKPKLRHDARQLTQKDWLKFSDYVNREIEPACSKIFGGAELHDLCDALKAFGMVSHALIGDFCKTNKLCFRCIGPVLTVLVVRQVFDLLGTSMNEALDIDLISIDPDEVDRLKGTIKISTTKKKSHDHN